MDTDSTALPVIDPEPAQPTVPVSIAITSFKGGAGKSLLSIHLAAEFAEQGIRTLLIDCDLQQSSSRWFNVSQKRGELPGEGKLQLLTVPPTEDLDEALASAPPADVRLFDVGGYVHERAVAVYQHANVVMIPVILEATSAIQAIQVRSILHQLAHETGQPVIPHAAIFNDIDMVAMRMNRTMGEVRKLLSAGNVPLCKTIIRRSNHFSDVSGGFGSLYSKLRTINSNSKLSPSSRRDRTKSVLDAVEQIKSLNNEIVDLLSIKE